MDQEESIRFAEKFVGDLVSFFGENINVYATMDDEVIRVDIDSSSLNSLLIGRNAENLRSIQFLVSNALHSQNAAITRVSVDIAGYKRQREEQIAEKARGWIEQVRSTGDSHVAHLNPADRRIVHRVASDYEDIQTFSEGEGRDRHVIIAQKSS